MKITRYAVIFVMITLISLLSLKFNVGKYSDVTHKKVEYNAILDSAIDSALESVVASADGNTVTIDKDACVSNFYKCLYSGFNAIDSNTTQAMLQLYTPILAIADEDGLYVNYSTEVSGEITKVWSQKIPYADSYTAKDELGQSFTYIVNYTMTDSLTITILGEQNLYSGNYEELVKAYKTTTSSAYRKIKAIMNGNVLGAPGYFEAYRDATITAVIDDKLNYYVNNHNRIAELYGEQYTFRIPNSATSEISRAIQSPSFISFFQGYPYGRSTSEVYSNFEVSGARVTKNQGYYVRWVDGYLYYHRAYCKATVDNEINDWFSSKEECARIGALPCPYCKP